MIERSLKAETLDTAREFKIVCVTGPRQSGKTTLCKQVFSDKPYVSLEDPDVAHDALTDGRKFLGRFKNGAVIDEIQRVPELFNYLQGLVDSKNKNNQFVLTGSNNFLMQEKISQSLAGRGAYIELLPFSTAELKRAKLKKKELGEIILNGFYPAIVSKLSSPQKWLENYIKTYIERDVRLIRNIGNILLFEKFLKLCAGRAGQLINVNSLSVEVGVDNKTIGSWLSVLQSSYIIFLLPPFFRSFNKRVIKSPKLYFYDTGILCYLLNLHSTSALSKSSYYGAIFENFVLAELTKNRANKEQSGKLYFLRDSSGNEVDVIIDKEDGLVPVEIKSAKKADKNFLKNIKWFQKVFRQEGGMLIFGGEKEVFHQNEIVQVPWQKVADI